MGSKTVEEKG